MSDSPQASMPKFLAQAPTVQSPLLAQVVATDSPQASITVQPPPPAQVVATPQRRFADTVAIILKEDGGEMGVTAIARGVLAKGLWPASKKSDLPVVTKAVWNAIALELRKSTSRFVRAGNKYKHISM